MVVRQSGAESVVEEESVDEVAKVATSVRHKSQLPKKTSMPRWRRTIAKGMVQLKLQQLKLQQLKLQQLKHQQLKQQVKQKLRHKHQLPQRPPCRMNRYLFHLCRMKIIASTFPRRNVTISLV
jgi:signal recognition particle subunit SEC65